jgi:hypothetical protein
MYWKLALKAAPFLAIAILIGVVLWMRGTNNQLQGERDLAVAENVQLLATNQQNAKTIEGLGKRQIDNDAIANAVAAKLAANSKRTEATRQALKDANHDPNVRAWAAVPVPDSVRRALSPPAH